MRKHIWLLAFALAFCGGCAGIPGGPETALQEKIPAPAKGAAKGDPPPYTRAVYESWHTARLQVAVRRFKPRSHRGPEIWLVSAMHIGEPSFYKGLQEILDARTVVLFEGVNTGKHTRHADHSQPSTEPEEDKAQKTDTASGGYSMQSKMASSLGLVFQLEAIDYDRTNFLNSDLSIQKLEKIMAQAEQGKPGSGGGQESLESLIHIMDGNSLMGMVVKWGMDFIASNPKLQALTKLTLVETIGGLKGDMSDMRTLPPDMRELVRVLIQNRNQKVIEDLKIQIREQKNPRASIAVFYGAGHMDDLEKRLTGELKYVPVDQAWMDAFQVDLRKGGVTESEARMTRSMVEWQLKQLRGN